MGKLLYLSRFSAVPTVLVLKQLRKDQVLPFTTHIMFNLADEVPTIDYKAVGRVYWY